MPAVKTKADPEPYVMPAPMPEVTGEKVTDSAGQIVLNHYPSRKRRARAIAALLGQPPSVVHRVIYDAGLEVIEKALGEEALKTGARKAARLPRRRVTKSP